MLALFIFRGSTYAFLHFLYKTFLFLGWRRKKYSILLDNSWSLRLLRMSTQKKESYFASRIFLGVFFTVGRVGGWKVVGRHKNADIS
jgi:hypothetical protein